MMEIKTFQSTGEPFSRTKQLFEYVKATPIQSVDSTEKEDSGCENSRSAECLSQQDFER